ncbi:histidine phosphatase family protein [Pseudomonas asplenii]|uniref:histidine phosphatase family protein n=1 Tax=Pseudomonas asplenii TaxID=53407 RepID=UPI001364BC9F|nr:histidine phosphatase family protein [Pseudomonas fuscovaginae]
MILYVRHGQTDCNSSNLWMGSIDSPLNKEGRIQAENVATELSGIFIDKIYSSPLVRAYETAQFIAEKQKKLPEIVILPGLRERCFGELEGTVKDEVTRRNLALYSGVESEGDFAGRIEYSMSSIDKNGLVLIVSHSAVFRCLIEKLGYSTTPSLERIMNCQIVQLDI